MELKKRIKPKFDSEGKMTNKKAVVTREEQRLKELFSDMPDDVRDIVESTIESLAFQKVALRELESILNVKGFVEAYTNGKNQYGYKESSEAKSYIRLAATCLNYQKQLVTWWGKDKTIEEKDELMAFISS